MKSFKKRRYINMFFSNGSFNRRYRLPRKRTMKIRFRLSPYKIFTRKYIKNKP